VGAPLRTRNSTRPVGEWGELDSGQASGSTPDPHVRERWLPPQRPGRRRRGRQRCGSGGTSRRQATAAVSKTEGPSVACEFDPRSLRARTRKAMSEWSDARLLTGSWSRP